MQTPFEGGCESGAVRYKITGEPVVIYACHCTVCQSPSGSAFAMAMRIPKEHFHLTQGLSRHSTGKAARAMSSPIPFAAIAARAFTTNRSAIRRRSV